MKLRVAVLFLAVSSACLDFDAHFDAGCENDAGWCRAGGGTSAGGGTTTGGGSAVGGGGGGEGMPGGGIATGGGATGGAGGGSSAVDAGMRLFPEAPCIGGDGWCWETGLGALGSTDLFAIWGTSDRDVFVAGSANSLFHYDGARWRQVLTPEVELPNNNIEPALFAVSGAPSGTVVISGEQIPLQGLSSAGAWSTLSTQPRWRPAMFSTATELLIVGNDANTHLERVTGNDQLTSESPFATRGDVQSVISDGTTAYVALNDPPRGVVSDSATMPSWDFQTLYGASRVGKFAARGTQPVLLFDQRSAWRDQSMAGGWRVVDAITGAVNPRAHAFTLEGSDWWWWVADEQAQIFSISPSATQAPADGGLLPSRRHENGGFDGFTAMWASPTNSVWAVSTGGRVVRLSGLPPNNVVVTEMTVPRPFGRTYGLDVRGSTAALVGQSGFLRYRNAMTDGGWTTFMASSENLKGVGITLDGGIVTIDDIGAVRQLGVANPLFSVKSDAGVYATYDRGAAVVIADDETLYASFRGELISRPRGGALREHPVPANWNHTGDLLAANDGVWLAVDDGTSSEASTSAVLFMPNDGGVAVHTCNVNAPGVVGLGAFDAGVAIAANGGLFTCVNGVVTAMLVPDVPTYFGTPKWTSVFKDARGDLWALTDSGYVFRDSGGGWERQRAPSGSSERSGGESWRLLSVGNTLYLGTGSAGLLTKTVP